MAAMARMFLASVSIFSCFGGGRLEDLLIAQGSRLSYVSLCSSRQLSFNTSALHQVSSMVLDAARGRVFLGDSAADGTARLFTLRMEAGARPEPVSFSGGLRPAAVCRRQ
ncbi:uncharacterized protein LOC119106013 [Pollicipes pollicipes]|uniref:uncharacterized protein LOC119106013 n=1 Tax=Pollicipes pollicipes TaxID=41117 RepID=UPI0018859A17|nr:uncharacterized protein LOC119106013 [Pollicipes pollicipes]